MNTNQQTALGYIIKTHHYTQQEVAEILGIKKQNIDAWVRGVRNIPSKYLLVLSQTFSNIPVEYFIKELTDIDKLKIQMMKLEHDCETAGYTLAELIK